MNKLSERRIIAAAELLHAPRRAARVRRSRPAQPSCLRLRCSQRCRRPTRRIRPPSRPMLTAGEAPRSRAGLRDDRPPALAQVLAGWGRCSCSSPCLRLVIPIRSSCARRLWNRAFHLEPAGWKEQPCVFLVDKVSVFHSRAHCERRVHHRRGWAHDEGPPSAGLGRSCCGEISAASCVRCRSATRAPLRS